MRCSVMFAGLFGWLLACCLSGQAQSVGSLDYGHSRQEAMNLENQRHQDVMTQLTAMRREAKGRYEERRLDCGGNRDCQQEAYQQYQEELKKIAKLEIKEDVLYGNRRDQIGRYYDKLGDSRTNRIDGRDGQRYVDKVPRPLKENKPPMRLRQGQWQIQVPDGRGGYRWIPAPRK